jgi:DNA-binding NarL/FixJ family response regulator
VVADDDEFVCTMVAAQLEDEFDCVGQGADALEAVALVATHRPDVAILDVFMPAGGALYATRLIRSRSPETAIVILTANKTAHTEQTLRDAGATAYVNKDADPRMLGVHVAAAMAAHSQSAADSNSR